MTDHDRGAYAPHADAPLAFDARRPSERRPLPMTLIASAAVLVAIVAALVLAYRGGVRGSEAPKPVGEPVSSIKTAAAPEAPTEDAGPKLDVYAAQNVPAAAPNFAPTPEEPKARPAAPAAETPAPRLQVRAVDTRLRIEAPEAGPTVRAASEIPAATPAAPPSRPVQTAAAAKPAPSPKPAPAAPAVQPRAVATAAVIAPASTKATRAAAEAPAKPLVVASAAAPTVRAATTVTPKAAEPEAVSLRPKVGGAAVQIGAFSSAALAAKGFADSAALVSPGGRSKSVETVSRDGKTFYRATLTGFADKEAAQVFCAKLAAKGGRCLVKG